MRAILIDPFAKTVSEIDINKDDVLSGLYSAMQCDTVDVVRYMDVDIWVDDEGLMKENQKFFHMVAGHQPLAGRAVIMESNDAGESIATGMELDVIEFLTMFEPE